MSAKKGEEAEEMQTNLQTNIINFADIEEGGGKKLKKICARHIWRPPCAFPASPPRISLPTVIHSELVSTSQLSTAARMRVVSAVAAGELIFTN